MKKDVYKNIAKEVINTEIASLNKLKNILSKEEINKAISVWENIVSLK